MKNAGVDTAVGKTRAKESGLLPRAALGRSRQRHLATGPDRGAGTQQFDLGRHLVALIPIVELGVSEAYAILTEHFGSPRIASVGFHRKRGLGAGLSSQPLSGDTRLGTRPGRSDRGRRRWWARIGFVIPGSLTCERPFRASLP